MHHRQTVLITGANRGIGLGLTSIFLNKGHLVYAACRHPDGARDLWELESSYPGAIEILEVDVLKGDSIMNLRERFASEELTLLINNAGILPNHENSFDKVSPENMTLAFQVNTIGPLMLCQALLKKPALSYRGTIANISSKVGSIKDNTTSGMYSYRISKSAQNMLTKCLSIELKDRKVCAVHPGWVKTGMGGERAPLDILDSAQGIYEVLMNLTQKQSGKFLDYRGQEIPW